MQKLYLFFLILLCFQHVGIRVSCADDKTIVFATEEWKDATNRDGTGLYWDILRAVYEPHGFKIRPFIRSYQGSINLVRNKTVNAMIGSYVNEIEEGIYPKNHFAVDIVQALYKKNSRIKWSGINTIIGKRVGWIEGYLYNEYIPISVVDSISIERVDSRENAFRQLKFSKLDFFIDAKGDLEDFFKIYPDYQKNDFIMETILELKLYMVFSADVNGMQLAKLFDQNFSLFLKEGKIKALYDKYSNANFTLPSDF